MWAVIDEYAHTLVHMHTHRKRNEGGRYVLVQTLGCDAAVDWSGAQIRAALEVTRSGRKRQRQVNKRATEGTGDDPRERERERGR
jgi:hypothetical protein